MRTKAGDWFSALLLGILLMLSDFWALPLIVGLIVITNTTNPNPPNSVDSKQSIVDRK